MTLTFEHLGSERTLAKHNDFIRAHKAGQMTDEQLAGKSWLLRVRIDGKQRTFSLSCKDKDAIRQAKDLLNGQQQKPSEFAQFLAAKDTKQSVTVGELADEWLAAGLPFNKTDDRELLAADRLRKTLGYALPWWSAKPVATVTTGTHEDYAAYRKPALRAADLELAALSSLCDWAMLASKIDKNPFEKRRTFSVKVKHCFEFSADDDEQLHKLLACLFAPTTDAHHQHSIRQSILAGGTLAFCALVGLRPGEAKYLLALPPLAETPKNTKILPPGTIFRDFNGTLRMKVQRLKRGQNPFVTLHPVAEQFLATWKAWLAREKICEDETLLTSWRSHHAKQRAAHIVAPAKDDRPLFPLGTDDQTTLNRALDRASDFLKLPHFKPHGFGRAYYVKVRRSQGEEDTTISGELGQTTNGELIRTTYGDPSDLVGGNLFDWLPEDGAPAWNLLERVKLPQPDGKAKTDLVQA